MLERAAPAALFLWDMEASTVSPTLKLGLSGHWQWAGVGGVQKIGTRDLLLLLAGVF